jgi:hypothetical protein
MPLDTLPPYVHIRELHAVIRAVDTSPRRPLNKSRGPSATFREMWVGQASMAPLSRDDARRFAAWLAARDGRSGAFGIVLKQGYATHPNAFAGTVSAANSGAANIVVTGTTGALLSGTLLTIGPPGEVGSQVVEVLDTVMVSGATAVNIAPRIRGTVANGSPIVGGDATLPVYLTSDDIKLASEVAHGVASFEFIEAVQ